MYHPSRMRKTSSRTLDRDNKIVYIWHVPNVVGVFNGEGPPVPIPNTEVKLTSAENTCLATDWEDRSMPTQSLEKSRLCFFIHVQTKAAFFPA